MSKTNILLESGTNELEIVEFFLEEPTASGGVYTGYYGVNVAKVLEIIRLPKVTEMPQTPHPCVLGTFNLRDKVVPLVDLGAWLGKGRSDVASDKVVVTEFNRVVSAFRVSGVTRIHRLSWEQIEPPNIQVQRYSANSVTGVVQLESRVVFILDMASLAAASVTRRRRANSVSSLSRTALAARGWRTGSRRTGERGNTAKSAASAKDNRSGVLPK